MTCSGRSDTSRRPPPSGIWASPTRNSPRGCARRSTAIPKTDCGGSSGASCSICSVARSEDRLSARVRQALEDPAPAGSEGLDLTPLEQLRHLAATAHSESVRVQALKVLLEREDRQAQIARMQPEE